MLLITNYPVLPWSTSATPTLPHGDHPPDLQPPLSGPLLRICQVFSIGRKSQVVPCQAVDHHRNIHGKSVFPWMPLQQRQSEPSEKVRFSTIVRWRHEQGPSRRAISEGRTGPPAGRKHPWSKNDLYEYPVIPIRVSGLLSRGFSLVT